MNIKSSPFVIVIWDQTLLTDNEGNDLTFEKIEDAEKFLAENYNAEELDYVEITELVNVLGEQE